MMETKENNERMAQCSRFNSCSVPICPLDDYKEKRASCQGDEVCTMAKAIRVRLGIRMKTGGLKPREIAAMKRWANLSEEQKAMHKEVLRKNRLILNKNKGAK